MHSNVTRHEVLNAQAYHFFIGEQTTFILVYLISIIAASVSFANFLKSGFVRFIPKYLSKRFVFSLLTVLLSFALKIYSLMTFVTMDSTGLPNWIRKDERTEGRSVIQEFSYWLLLFVLPNATFALVSLIALQSQYLSYKRVAVNQKHFLSSLWGVIKLSLRTFANAPAILIIPAFGTITFRYRFVSTDAIDALNKAEMKLFSSSVNEAGQVLVPRVDVTLSSVNAAISLLMVAITGVGRLEFTLIVLLWVLCFGVIQFLIGMADAWYIK